MHTIHLMDEDGHFPPDNGLVPPLKMFQRAGKSAVIVLWVVFAVMYAQGGYRRN